MKKYDNGIIIASEKFNKVEASHWGTDAVSGDRRLNIGIIFIVKY